jgi:hypothetical protein
VSGRVDGLRGLRPHINTHRPRPDRGRQGAAARVGMGIVPVWRARARRYSGGMGDLVVWAFELAGEKLAEVLPRRWAHVQGVGRRAHVVAPLFSADDRKLLFGAGLLHDIGYAPELVDTGFHPIDGARYLRGVGGPDRLVHLVAHHSCATLEAELRGLSDELTEYEDERTALRDALWWADMTTTPDGGETTAVERVAEIQSRYGPDDLVSCFIRRAWDDLNTAVERTERRLEAAVVS